jgi:hypothetical protein
LRPHAFAAAAVAAATLLTPIAQAQSPAPQTVYPGRWEYKYRIAFIPVATEYWCFKPDAIERAFEGPCNRHHTCTYSVREVADGKVRLVGQWKDKKGRIAPVSAQGGYTLNTINLRLNVKTTNGVPLTGTMSARRISNECAAGDK